MTLFPSIKRGLVFFTTIFALLVFGLFSTSKAHASNDVSGLGLLDINKGQVKVTVTNDETGETTVLHPKIVQDSIKFRSLQSSNDSLDVGYEVFVPLTNSNSSGITPATDDGGVKTSGGVTARLNVNYDVSANNEQVRLNRVYGSWTPSSSLYSVTNRKVDAHSGSIHGKKISKAPTSNTFSYTTGWGYNYRAFGDFIPRAWSSATVKVSGMTATHTIKVEFTYSG
ncbi:hypothetical protein [Priestia taiwanensis]|uniref:Uncharacterized protein n=1 Tax=Priestia taiwanensis TaxID=1347902 RepID=A0A917EQ22_9BACI|nr:hypothetical protein [Priestia taiwanensis]MBM7364049.1 hypothetical protein [Priestia taiwanensis]GGE71205.1 hypothetical protein GCM10007140_21390 [Priestia taiwanensis]